MQGLMMDDYPLMLTRLLMWRKSAAFAMAALALVATLGTSIPSAADTARDNDPNDSRGPLDIKWISHGHYGDQLEHRIATFEGWDSDDLPGTANFAVAINVLSDDPPPDSGDYGQSLDACIGVSSRRGGLRGKMVNCESEARPIGPVTVLHPRRSILILRFPDSYLEDPGPYEWGLQTYVEGVGPCKDRCIDFAPGEGPLDLHMQHPR